MDLQDSEDFGRSQENGRISGGSPQQLRRARYGNRLLHCFYILGMAFVIAMMVKNILRERKSYDETYAEYNAAQLNNGLELLSSIDKQVKSLKQDIRRMQHGLPSARRLSAQQQLALQDQQQDLDLASARQDFLEDYDLTQASLRAERQTRPRSESLSQQSPEETEGRQREPERVKAN